MKFYLFLFLSINSSFVFAQDLKKQYEEFNTCINLSKTDEALIIAEELTSETSKLSIRRKAIVSYKLASYYEKKVIDYDKAILYFEKSLVFEPEYYVPHLALGYLYTNKANEIGKKINAETNITKRNNYLAEYKSYLKKSIPHYEKAMACDENDQVLTSIEKVYTALKNPEGFKTLNSRLPALKQNCIDLLIED